ncbi:MAG: DUF5320 domain-containing protein [Candidatus Marinimicrobia bacterium]|nr:DUF5320 domain-containing protein [Candidatus Neomarinimicrobiota bacterium]
MPRLDGTGPRGEGSQTGRGRGDCRVGFRSCFCPRRGRAMSLEEEEKMLEEELKVVREEKKSLEDQK